MANNPNTSTQQPDRPIDAILLIRETLKTHGIIRDECKFGLDWTGDVRARANNFVVPLATFAGDRGADIVRLANYASGDIKDAGTVAACAAAITTLSQLSNQRPNSGIRVSFAKETPISNTSVTQGIAASIAQRGSIHLLRILNCGTGGVKVQLYVSVNGDVYKLGEVKADPISDKNTAILVPAISDEKTSKRTKLSKAVGPSPSQLRIIDEDGKEIYAPKSHPTLVKDLHEFYVNMLAYSDTVFELMGINISKVETYAVVTGSIRAKWAAASPCAQLTLCKVINQCFDGCAIPWDGKCYFITQEAEGAFEFRSTTRNIEVITGEPTDLGASFGIGRGSTQCANCDGEIVTGLGETGMEKGSMDDIPKRAMATDWFVNIPDNSIIAVKSGPVIGLNAKNANATDLRRAIFEPVTE